MSLRLVYLDPLQPEQAFPGLESALAEPNGLLAVGGCLSPRRLVNAYRHGVFPWFSPGEPILWWSPNPRLVLFPEHLHISGSLRKTLRRQTFQLSIDQAFERVIDACAAPRSQQPGTWITEDMRHAYLQLHHLGIAHSVESWLDGQLIGGLYGIAIGKVFFGESMFYRATDASKVAMAHLATKLLEWDYRLIDCQVSSNHLLSLGAQEMPRREFAKRLQDWCRQTASGAAWRT